MKILIIAIGKEKDFSGYELVQEYTERISHYYPCEWKYITGVDQVTDNNKLLETIEKNGSGSYVIALDEIGKEYSSKDFSGKIESCLNQSIRTIIFIIGGSDGYCSRIERVRYLKNPVYWEEPATYSKF